MSESIMALKALRDAARTMRDLPNVADSMIGAYLGIECAADRAIASLEAAEQPEPCACGGGAGTSGWSHSIHGCHHLPKSPAEQAQQPANIGHEWYDAESGDSDDAWCRRCLIRRNDPNGRSSLPCSPTAQQPAPADVPPMPKAWPYNGGQWCKADAVRVLHAACARIARQHKFSEAMRVQLREKYDRTRRELEAVKEDKRCALDLLTQERARADKAEAELAALKGQEPVGFMRRSLDGKELGEASEDYMENGLWGPSFPVYAAPVPPPDSVPREQHEAALAEAKHAGLREALELVERDMKRAAAMGAINAVWPALNEAADGIRALAEKGGEVGK